MGNSHILIVDDDHRIRSLLKKYLCSNGYFITSAHDTEEARQALELFVFDLIILDIMLPRELGTDFALKLRETSQVAILMLTAMGNVQERIKGLESGADDYLAKPFEPKELLLRINKILYRTQKYLKEKDEIISIGNIKYNLSKDALEKNDYIDYDFSFCDCKLLNIFIKNMGIPLDREFLSKELKINPRSIDVQVTRLRNKVEPNPKKPLFLQTVRGKGYILHVDR